MEKKERSERTKVVVDETTIYEIDLDCMECRRNGGRKGERKSEKNSGKGKRY